MTRTGLRITVAATLFATLHGVGSAADARVESFSPQGEVKSVRQATARFSQPMVPFGDPRRVDPFDIDCAAKGRARWADARNWVYDFEEDLPAGLECRFALKAGLKSLSGAPLAEGQRFSFTTGGPAIRRSLPHEGARLDENQVFILALDAPARPDTIAAHAYCEVEGINERVGVRVLAGDEKAAIVAQRDALGDRFYRLVFKDTPEELVVRIREKQDDAIPLAVVQCRRALPNGARFRLVWGRGVTTESGVATSRDQALAFRVRDAFTAQFNCTRVNARSPCVPVLPMHLSFSAPIERAAATKITLRPEQGSSLAASLPEGDAPFVQGVTFPAPLPAATRFRIELPAGLRDDAGRPLANAGSFPLEVATDTAPPLAKFAARFGIIERVGGAVLPVTLRNVEPEVAGRVLDVGAVGMSIPGSALAVRDDYEIIAWLKRLNEAGEPRFHREPSGRQWVERQGESSIFDVRTPTRPLSVPKPNGPQALEVVGIPLPGPGFHIVELASPRLGAALHGEDRPYYVATGALVTNLAVHFKRGRESSLVWVTTLDAARPVPDASIAVRDCRGRLLWEGRTGDDGVASIRAGLPLEGSLPLCSYFPGRYFVSARTATDLAFALSAWSDGIQPWQFNLPTGGYGGALIAHTVLDRTLFRAGETASMKHYLRRHTENGFAVVEGAERPAKAIVAHQGSGQRFELALDWQENGTALNEWRIPRDAKLGVYTIDLVFGRSRQLRSGSFRVEAFRVPTMKALVQPPAEPLVNASEARVDVLVTYLSGGGAGFAPVKLRSQVQPKSVSYPDYEDFVFGGEEVAEGTERRSDAEADEMEAPGAGGQARVVPLQLDAAGAARATLDKLPASKVPQDLVMELEYQDANGETLTSAARVPLWPARFNLGIRTEGWAASRDALRFQIVALDLQGKPAPDVAVGVDLFQRKRYAHRKRLIGGFYAYEDYTETKRVGESVCKGRTDTHGLLVCQITTSAVGEVVLHATAPDGAGNVAVTNRSVYVVGADRWWFRQGASDRMDVIPEKKRYEPGERARFQVRMPFAHATALITVEREGIIESHVQELAGREPVIELPLEGRYAPNVYVSVLAVRGRLEPPPLPLALRLKGLFGPGSAMEMLAKWQAGPDIRPTATIDLGKPAFRLGIAEIRVGWSAHELEVAVRPNRDVFRVRERAIVDVDVRRPDGSPPPIGADVALAAVDEGLLELAPNRSWKLLDAMMQRRGIEVTTATAQMQVVGKRHYGRKAVPPGGGGGRQSARELFDTLLLWQGRVPLDERGHARVEVPLNDSLTSFRIVAVASGASGLFGTGAASIRTTQDLMLHPALPAVAREGDEYLGGATVRNASARPMTLEVAAKVTADGAALPGVAPQTQELAPGEAREFAWRVAVPVGATGLTWEIAARDLGGTAVDRVRASQRVIAAYPVRTVQATLVQVGEPLAVPVAIPDDALPGRGGISVDLRTRLGDGLTGVREFMSLYPFTCIEQRVSQAVALRDEGLWRSVIDVLPNHLDRDGLVKYFPSDWLEGSDALTAYLLAVAHEAGWTIPDSAASRMRKGLVGFVEGRVRRYGSLPTADLAIRKVAAIEALARYGDAVPSMFDSIDIEPNLWPTSAVLDWLNALSRMPGVRDRDARRVEAIRIIRARLNFQGTMMGFSTERSDALWWLMISADVNAVRAVLALLDEPGWREDLPRMARGALERRRRGHWSTTTANAWGTLALEKFSVKFESAPVTGTTTATLAGRGEQVQWSAPTRSGSMTFPWPTGEAPLAIAHGGSGHPWATIAARAAIPLKAPFSSGFSIHRTVAPIEQRTPGAWTRGDVVRVTLELEAQSDMTWVVVSDPVPAGAAILGSGLGRDSQLLTRGEKRAGWVWPAYEERGFEAFRAYYEFVPKGKWKLEYTLRLNSAGRFELPATRVEAMYAPEMFGEIPNAAFVVAPR